MQTIAFLILMLTSLNVFGQSDSTIAVDYDSTTYISLVSEETYLTQLQLDTGFTIKLSDPEAKLLKFSMIYFFDINGNQGLQQISFEGNRAFIDEKFPKISLFKDPRSNFITLEHVYFERKGKRFKARNLFIPLK